MIDVKVGLYSVISQLPKNNKTIYVAQNPPALWFGTHEVPIWNLGVEGENGADIINKLIGDKNFVNAEEVEQQILNKNYITLEDVDTIEGPQGASGAQGAQGAKGAKGDKGDNGITYYTWIKYADSAQGDGLADSPIGEGGELKQYIGFAYNKLTPEESNDPVDYVWALFKGTNGTNGIGVKGEDGRTYYTWIKYADVLPLSNSDMYDEPTDKTEWIGISVNNESQVEAWDYTLYTWSKFKGDKGAQGAAGKDGQGITYYTWIKYADDESGNGLSNEPWGEDGSRKLYIGMAYNQITPEESNDPAAYRWYRFAGTDGADGVGYKGEDGKTYYMWIKYSDQYPTKDSDLYDEPTQNTEWIGIAYNKEDEHESTNWTLYSWSKFKGDQGVAGNDGVTYYTWIKYADDELGNGISNEPISENGEFKSYIGFAYGKLTPIESENPHDYQWTLFKGTNGKDGIGVKGADGKTYYTWIKYSDNYPTSPSDIYDTPTEVTEWIGIATNKEEQHESDDFTLYTWAKFKGPQGTDGIPGKDGAPGADGITLYTWIKYADSVTGEGISNKPFDADGNRKLYIGFAYGRTSPEESDDPKDYQWSQFAGTDGTDGVGYAGADGKTYYMWIKYADEFPTAQTVIYDTPKETTEWIGISPNHEEQEESWDYSLYEWSNYKGAQGVAGINGTTYYTWIKYADNEYGLNMTNTPFDENGNRKLYIGFAYNQTTSVESDNPNLYKWSRFAGYDGEKGIGVPGKDGKTYYTWIKYSTKYPSQNSDLYDVPTEETEWIGISPNNEEELESWDWTLYSWSKFKGDQGVPGPKGDKGDKGADGKTYYTWIRYADDENGNGMSDTPLNADGSFKNYIGFAYGKDTAQESDVATDYTWSRFTGKDGINGTDGIGVKGADGKTYYTWIKYSDSYPKSNADLYDEPTANTEYIGISVNNEEQEESWDWTLYTWSKFKGDQGVAGKDAITLYTWVRYADDAVGNGMSNQPSVNGVMKEYIGFAWNKNTATESNDPADYQWSRIKGADGAGGSDGVSYQGEDGKTYYMWLKYADQHPSVERPEIYDEPTEDTEYMGIAVNQLDPQESLDWKLYTWAHFKGPQGTEGIAGKNGITYYTWIRYADDENGNGMTNEPFVSGIRKLYIGFAYNQTSSVESDDPNVYSWTRFQGTDGEDGIGYPGADGKTYYMWIKYSDEYPTKSEDLYDEPNDNTKYIGISVNNESQAESNDPQDYAWSLFKGADGVPGVQGAKGERGVTTYTWIKYADDINGKNMSNDPFVNGQRKLFIGFAYNQESPIESQNPDDYQWTQFSGTDGKDGIGYPGADGKTYYMWIKYSDEFPTSDSDIYDTPTENTKYMGIAANKETQEESSDWTVYSWALFKGADGVPGKDGTDGVPSYTWIKYANTRTGDGISDNPLNEDGTFKDYIGFAYNKHTPEESNNPGDYQWSLFKGTNGKDGIDGLKGADGSTYYTWIKYATVFPTKDEHIYDEPTELTKWIGIAVNQLIMEESTDYTKYTWSKFQGDQGVAGEKGEKGEKGDAGKTYYTWIRYANDENGTDISDSPLNNDGTYKEYIGFAFDKDTPIESENPADYMWSKFKGEDGINGKDGIGIDGKDGKTYYMWIKYSSVFPTKNEDIYDEPIPDETKYIGIAYNKTEQHESDDYTLYDWSLIRGAQGVAGTNGNDGITHYTWIKYANDENGVGLSDSPLNEDGTFKKYIGFAYNMLTQEESDDPNHYMWSLFKGTDGTNGINGEKGADGTTYYTWIKYADNYPNSNDVIIYDTPKESTAWIGIAVNQTIQAESSDYTKYDWSNFKGSQGVKGDKGDAGKDGSSINIQGTIVNWYQDTSIYIDGIDELWAIDDPLSLYWHDGTAHQVIPTKGDGYILNRPGDPKDGHLIMTDGVKWVDCGAIKGPQGAQGEQGKNGEQGQDGRIFYTWIKYADDREGNGISNDPLDSNGNFKKYIGFAYNKLTSEESNNPGDYQWSLFKGTDGKNGIDGEKGADGKTYYTWIKYADNVPTSDADIYDIPTANTAYIGIATNQESKVESNSYLDYVWNKFRGDDGLAGTDGKTTYTWIKYADDNNGGGMSDSPFAELLPRTELTFADVTSRLVQYDDLTAANLSTLFR